MNSLTNSLTDSLQKVDDNNKLKQKLKLKEESPLPPFFEESESFGSVESPKKELLPLKTEGEEKEKSCAKKEKEGVSYFKASRSHEIRPMFHYITLWRKSIREAINSLKMDSTEHDEPPETISETLKG